MSHDDFAFEPIRGVPAELPAGERLLWQGSPRWQSLAVRAYHTRKVAVYFAVLIAWRILMGFRQHDARSTLISVMLLAGLGAVAVAVLSLLAHLNARSTVYSITSRRLLLRHGIAVPLTLNVPFTAVDSVDLKEFADGTGELSFGVPREQRVGYLITWPHLRPGRIARPSPSFKALPDAHVAADRIAAALALSNTTAAPEASTEIRSADRPGRQIEVPSASPAFSGQTAAA